MVISSPREGGGRISCLPRKGKDRHHQQQIRKDEVGTSPVKEKKEADAHYILTTEKKKGNG